MANWRYAQLDVSSNPAEWYESGGQEDWTEHGGPHPSLAEITQKLLDRAGANGWDLATSVTTSLGTKYVFKCPA
jgi:hypothetical protein